MYVFLEWKMVEESKTLALGMLEERGKSSSISLYKVCYSWYLLFFSFIKHGSTLCSLFYILE
jgi:hypothetical protein